MVMNESVMPGCGSQTNTPGEVAGRAFRHYDIGFIISQSNSYRAVSI